MREALRYTGDEYPSENPPARVSAIAEEGSRGFRTVFKGRRRVRVGAAALAILGAMLAIGAGTSGAAMHNPKAHAAGVLDGKATARLHLVQVEGSELSEEGPVAGVLVGTARGTLHLGAIFIASFTIRTPNGSITGRGTAIPHGTGRYQSFAGSFTATGGSGRYAHIRGRAGLYGVLDRRTDSVVIQTTGRLSY